MAYKTKNASRGARIGARRERREKKRHSNAIKEKETAKPEATATASHPAASNPPDGQEAAAAEPTSKAQRRQRRQEIEMGKLRMSMKRWERVMRDYRECRVLAAKAMDELCDAKKQLRQVKAVVNFLIKQRPHNGTFFDERWGMWSEWSGIE